MENKLTKEEDHDWSLPLPQNLNEEDHEYKKRLCETILKQTTICPKCDYTWNARKSSPKACPRCKCRLDFLKTKLSTPYGIERIEECLKGFSKRYEIDYEKHEDSLKEALMRKLRVTKKDITEHDCKEVCKFIAEDEMK